LIRTTLVAGLVLAGACSSEPPAPSVGDPRDTALALLALHDLEGQQPEERSDESKRSEVHREALAELIGDLDSTDRFTADLYVGFIVGALARHQTRLFVSRQGSRAVVSAGKARIALRLDGAKWRIVLAESVPDEIKRRAVEAKQAYEAAKARGQAGAATP